MFGLLFTLNQIKHNADRDDCTHDPPCDVVALHPAPVDPVAAFRCTTVKGQFHSAAIIHLLSFGACPYHSIRAAALIFHQGDENDSACRMVSRNKSGTGKTSP